MSKDKIPSHRKAAILSVLINGERYGREICKEYEKRTRQKMSLGTLYVILCRMENDGLIKGRIGEATEIRKDNRRKYFRITGAGQKALTMYDEYAMRLRGAQLNG